MGFFPKRDQLTGLTHMVHEKMILIGKFTISDKTVAEEKKIKYYNVLYGAVQL